MRHIEINKEWNDRQPFTEEEIEELELLNEKYVVGDKTMENLTMAIRIRELMDKCETK